MLRSSYRGRVGLVIIWIQKKKQKQFHQARKQLSRKKAAKQNTSMQTPQNSL